MFLQAEMLRENEEEEEETAARFSMETERNHRTVTRWASHAVGMYNISQLVRSDFSVVTFVQR